MNKQLVIALASVLTFGFVSATSYAEPPPAAPAPSPGTKDEKKDEKKDPKKDEKTDKTAPAKKDEVKGDVLPAGKK